MYSATKLWISGASLSKLKKILHPFVFILVIEDSHVAFYATLKKKTSFDDGETVIFDNVITNFGNKYSGTCGAFTGENAARPIEICWLINKWTEGTSVVAQRQSPMRLLNESACLYLSV